MINVYGLIATINTALPDLIDAALQQSGALGITAGTIGGPRTLISGTQGRAARNRVPPLPFLRQFISGEEHKAMKRETVTLVLMAGAMLVAACGTTIEQKAATGAVAGAVVAGPVGAAAGAAAGTVVGQAEDPERD